MGIIKFAATFFKFVGIILGSVMLILLVVFLFRFAVFQIIVAVT